MMPSSAPSGQYELSYISGYKGTHSSCALFHPILEDVAIYSIGSLVVISSIRDPRKQQLLKNHNEDVCTIAVSPNGEFIASGQKGSQYYSKNAAPVVISHFKTGEKVLQLDGLCKQVLALSFSPDSRFLAASGANGIFYVWNVLTGAVVVSKRAEASVTSIAWGEMITSYNQSSDKNGGYHHDSYQSSVADMVLSKNPTYFLCSSNGAHVRYHRLVYSRKKMQYLLNTNNCALPSRGLHRDFTSLVMDPSLRYILCGSDAGEFINFQIGNESASRRKYFDNENDAMGSIGQRREKNIGSIGLAHQQRVNNNNYYSNQPFSHNERLRSYHSSDRENYLQSTASLAQSPASWKNHTPAYANANANAAAGHKNLYNPGNLNPGNNAIGSQGNEHKSDSDFTTSGMFRHCIQNMGVFGVNTVSVTSFAVFTGAGDGTIKKMAGHDKDWSVLAETQLQGSVASISVSADEQELLVGTDQAWLVRLSTRDLSILGTVSKGHTQEVVGISISSSNNGNDNFNHGNGISNNNGNGNSNNDNNGKDDLYCSISSDGSLNVYDLESLVLISTFKRHNKIRGTSIFAINNKNNSNSRFILTGWSDGKVQCYRISAPTPMSSSSVSEPTLCWEILAAQHTVTSIYHCELYMATGASDGTISLWSNATRQNLAFFNAHGGEVSRIFTHLSDPSLLISSGDRTLTTFSLKTETKRERVRIRDGAITGMAHLSPVGFTTSSSSPPFTHNNRYSANNQYTQNNNQQPHVQPPNRSHQNHNVLTCDTRGCLRVWDFYQYDPNSAVLSINVSNQALCCLAVSASGRYVATGGEERTVFVYEVVQSQSSEYMLELVSVCNGHTGSIKDISFSTDERSIVSVGEDSSLCVWDINTHQY